MDWLSLFLKVILFVKVLFLFVSFRYRYLVYTKSTDIAYTKSWKELLHGLFFILMSMLLIVLFVPFRQKMPEITHEIKLILFVYGLMILVGYPYEELYERFKEINHLK